MLNAGSDMAVRHSRATSSTIRNRRTEANWGLTKFNDQRALAFASTRIGARVPTAVALSDAAYLQTLLAIKPIDAVDPGRFAVAGQKDEQPPIAETPALVGKIAQLRPQGCIQRTAGSVANHLSIRSDD